MWKEIFGGSLQHTRYFSSIILTFIDSSQKVSKNILNNKIITVTGNRTVSNYVESGESQVKHKSNNNYSMKEW